METIGFGGGCHWCTEAVFQHLRGVARVEQGWARGAGLAESEAVRVRFDPGTIDLATLVEVHLRTHASTSAHSLRGRYRSAVYVTDAAQRARVEGLLAELQSGFDAPLVTRTIPLAGFRENIEHYRDYYRTDPERPFCRTYIDPKLGELRRRFADVALWKGCV